MFGNLSILLGLGTLLAHAAFALPTESITHTFDIRDESAGSLATRAITGNVLCETSADSPPVADIHRTVDQLRIKAHHELCIQNNGVGSFCTLIAASGSARVSICGKWTFHVTCDDAAEAVLKVVDGCTLNGRAGGRFFLDNTPLNIAVH